MACKDYAIYKGDEFLFLGKVKECAEFLDIEPSSIMFLATPSYRKRLAKRKTRNPLIVIKIEDDE